MIFLLKSSQTIEAFSTHGVPAAAARDRILAGVVAADAFVAAEAVQMPGPNRSSDSSLPICRWDSSYIAGAVVG